MTAQEPEQEMTPEEETCLELFMYWEVDDNNRRNIIYVHVRFLFELQFIFELGI